MTHQFMALDGVVPQFTKVLAMEKKIFLPQVEFYLSWLYMWSLICLSMYITPGGDIRMSLLTLSGCCFA